MSSTQIFLIIGFFSIAVIYSSVGFGGGSSYLALLAQPFLAFSPDFIKPTALLCNIVVVSSSTYIFYRSNQLEWKRVWPFLVASVPLAFLGAYWKINDHLFFAILGCSLLAASILLWIQPRRSNQIGAENRMLNGAMGGAVGFLSGLVGIGGGIFLSPLLNLIHWDHAKKIAALASVFILANSISGLAGIAMNDARVDWTFITPLLIAVLAGGQIGSRLAVKKFNATTIKRITAILIFIAAANILRDHML